MKQLMYVRFRPVCLVLALSSTLFACQQTGDALHFETDSTDGENKAALTQAPFSLTIDEVAGWTADGPLADPNNVSSVPLAGRFVDSHSQLNPKLPSEAKLLLAPDGIGNYANYLTEQAVFNHYTFTHWSSVDLINWFGGTAELNVSIPSRPWVETAHRNGVKVLGTVFFAPKAWGGSDREPGQLLLRDKDGEFVYARQLIEIAKYYGFDGWLMNQETDVSSADPALGGEMLAFMADLTARRPDGMEIHWYDAMLPDGRVAWQNELNANNAPFLQNGSQRTADAMFVNYWWNRARVQTSLATASDLSRSPYDVYTGADLWPGRQAQDLAHAPQWLGVLDGPDGAPVTSIALFASNYSFLFTGSDEQPAESMFATDENDVAAFYRSANRLFGGDDGNPAVRDDAGRWPGIGSRIPARSTLQKLPFNTNFSAGHGRLKAEKGIATKTAWHDIAVQDMLPTWQFAVQGSAASVAATRVDFDFERAYEKGNSLRIAGNPSAGTVSVPLYKTSFKTEQPLDIELVHALTTDYQGATLWLEVAEGKKYRHALTPTNGKWRRSSMSLDIDDDTRVIRIGVDLESDTSAEDSGVILHLGELRVRRAGTL